MFQLAERRDDLAQCRRAGSFALDCEMHVLTRRLRALDTSVAIDAYAAAVERLLERDDLPVTEARYWSAAFRRYLEKSPDPDRRRCKTLQDPLRRDACWNTGIAVYNDLLNRLRDRRRIDCTRSEPPDALRRPGDPELSQILDDRWPEDLCTPRH